MRQLLSMAALRARGLEYSDEQVWRLVRAGKLPTPIKISGKNFFVEEEIEACLDRAVAARDAKTAA